MNYYIGEKLDIWTHSTVEAVCDKRHKFTLFFSLLQSYITTSLLPNRLKKAIWVLVGVSAAPFNSKVGYFVMEERGREGGRVWCKLSGNGGSSGVWSRQKGGRKCFSYLFFSLAVY